MSQRRATGSIVFAVLGSVAFAQPLGDWDGDGDVDADDAIQLGAALQGPAGADAVGADAAFDRPDDGDAKVTLADGIVVQSTVGPPNSECDDGVRYYYAGYDLPRGGFFLTGATARIDRRETLLCAEPGGTGTAASSAWVSVVGLDVFMFNPDRWAQIGYTRSRDLPADGETVPPGVGPGDTFIAVFVEVADLGDFDDQYIRQFFGILSGQRDYGCQLFSSNGQWVFGYNGANLTSIILPGQGWRDKFGERAQWMGETWNANDRLVGQASSRCRFVNCGFRTGLNNFESAQFAANDPVVNTAPGRFEVNPMTTSGFEIWDKRD